MKGKTLKVLETREGERSKMTGDKHENLVDEVCFKRCNC